MLRLSLALITSVLTSAAVAQDHSCAACGGLDTHLWEAKVSPPPEGEWLKHMPRGVAPRAVPGHSIRAYYLVPSNRSAQSDAVPRMRQYLVFMRDYYRDQMELNGFGDKTIQFETEADGVTPKIHVINAPNTDTYYNADPWTRVTTAAQAAGLPVWSPNQIWLSIFEGHIENPDGSYTGEFNGGASFGSGNDAGVGMTNSNTLALALASRMTNNTNYAGQIVPEFGPYPMAFGLSSPSFDGTTLGSLSSVRHGVVIHELSHAFGLPHDFRNDQNFAGNIMGNGFRGFRGWIHPNSYSSEGARTGYATALALNASRYFNNGQNFTETVKPTAQLLTSGAVAVVDGHLEVRFTASDASGLSCALLQMEGNYVDEMVLSGTSVDRTFRTPWFDAGVGRSYTVNVYDTQGNRTDVSASITVASGPNRAPRPSVFVQPQTMGVGNPVSFSASNSFDPDGGPLTVEWDFDGDGTYDTVPSTLKSAVRAFVTPGIRMIRCRVTDNAGAQSVSSPVALRITAIPTSADPSWILFD